MDTPQYQQAPLDPAFLQLHQQTQQQDIEAVQGGLKQDSASLLARYGANLAMANAGGSSSPGVSPMQLSARVG